VGNDVEISATAAAGMKVFLSQVEIVLCCGQYIRHTSVSSHNLIGC